MTGTGELWVGDDGLPLRQVLSLTFPPDTRDYVTTAAITVDFFDFAPVPTRTASHRAGHAIVSGRRGVPGRQALMSGIVVGIGLLFVALVIGRRRNRMIYAAVVASMIASILVVPLLNSRRVYAYSAEQVAKQARAMQLRADADAQAAVQDVLAAPRMKPDRAPLAAAQEQAAATDDPSRYADARCESDPDGDPDGDTLTNLEECLLGTLLDVADSDGDGADDNFEVTGVVYNGITWYSDPLYPDSNHDGLPDGKEWFTDADANGEAELDTDGDGTPDIWDNDNDGDGVIDKLDMSPQTSTASTSATVRTFTDADPLELTLDQLEVGELVKVEFQLRPENPAHLWYSQNVLNWPQGDQQGNIQDADGKTFYDIDNTTSPSPNANGDVRMVPMLEITFQEADANLPPAATCTDDDGNNYTCYPLLEDFGISVTTLDDNDSVAYVPLQLVADSTGDANVAFYGRMMYEASGSWSTPHQVRMVWAVQALNDICAEYTNNICTSYSSYNEIQVVHTYYDDWFLTGLHLTEEHSANMALVYEDPVETSKVQPGYDAPFYTDVQFGLLYGLDKTLMAGRCAPLSTDGGCDAGATRDFTVADVYNRFNHTTNSAVSATARWNLPNVLGVEYNEYESIDLGLLDTTITQTVRILDDHFTGAWTATAPITPTIMSVYEQQYRDLNLDQSMTGSSHVAWNGNDLTLSLPQSGSDAVGVDTMVSLKWTPYAYDPVTGWAAADIQQYWNSLNADWGPSFVDPQYPGQAETYQTLAQHQYMSVYSGANTVVQMGDVVIPASYQAPDETIADEFGIDTTNYALKTMVAYYGVSDDLAEVATYL
ncbi:MAG: thrombospondin type 3 repeat-containing protein, partial [Caldilineaceae bacterium]|nr:thrombospondin type 3 repeat-containing protein [Caldilineaceae bacterium]